jgi:outer membrane lipoprotein carrier protein
MPPAIRRKLSRSVCCAAFVFASACASGAQTQPLPSARQIATAVDSHYNSLRNLRADFTETYQGPGVDRSESGTLTLEKPGRMRWDYDTPAGKVFLVDGKDAYFYVPGSDAERAPVKTLADMRSPLRFLLGKTELARELDGLSVAEVNGLYRLTGTPRGGTGQVTSIALDVTASGDIRRIRTTQADGTMITLVFGATQTNLTIAPDEFTFNPPPGVRIVDGLTSF